MSQSAANPIDIPVIMCTWNRIKNIVNTIHDLEQQDGIRPHLTIWNNNSSARSELKNLIANTDSTLDIKVINSPTNIGGIARFRVAKDLKKDDYVIFIDDDQRLSRTFLKDLYSERSKTTISSIWAFKMTDPTNYWNRLELNAGEEANYCGTGGMIAPTSVFRHERLFDIPEKYGFIEDLWLSYFATTHLGLTLHKSKAIVVPSSDDNDGLWRLLLHQKTEFLQYLIKAGWRI